MSVGHREEECLGVNGFDVGRLMSVTKADDRSNCQMTQTWGDNGRLYISLIG
jgi:hypothetical protein